MYELQGNLTEALKCFSNALQIMRVHYGEDNFQLALAYQNIGMVILWQGNAAEAQQYLKKAMTI